jgi:hypothetical protein
LWILDLTYFFIAYIHIKYFLTFSCEIVIFIAYILMKCFLTFSCGIAIYIASIHMDWFFFFFNGITIYIDYINMKCFLTFPSGIIIYSLHPHKMFLNFSMWDIKNLKYFFKIFLKLTRVNLYDLEPDSLAGSTPGRV